MQRILLLQHFLEILAMQRGVLQNRRSKIATMGRKTETKNTNYMWLSNKSRRKEIKKPSL